MFHFNTASDSVCKKINSVVEHGHVYKLKPLTIPRMNSMKLCKFYLAKIFNRTSHRLMKIYLYWRKMSTVSSHDSDEKLSLKTGLYHSFVSTPQVVFTDR